MNSNSGRGIWTTSSGGLVSTVSATYGNDSGKDISVYGKNSAFSSNSTDGATLIGKLNAKTGPSGSMCLGIDILKSEEEVLDIGYTS